MNLSNSISTSWDGPMLYYIDRPRRTCQPDLLRPGFVLAVKDPQERGQQKKTRFALSGVSLRQICSCP